MNTATPTTLGSTPPSQNENLPAGRTAGFLRMLGAMAIGGSGILYMLQGLYHTNTDLRSWVYLALMAALGAGGIFSQRLMQDSKGARLFFALAVLLIPVQFSQLGGMTLSVFADAQTNLSWFAITTPELPVLILIGGLSMLAAIALSFAGFSVLARPAAKSLSCIFIVMNGLLLLPFRDSFAILPIVAAISALVILLEIHTFRRNLIFQTLEGVAVRLMMLLPLVILVCRSAFYLSDIMGISAILGVVGLFLHYLASCSATIAANKSMREFFWLMSFILLVPTVIAMTHELVGHSQGLLLQLDNAWLGAAYILPVLACALYFSARSHLLSLFYQMAACGILCVGIAWVLDSRYVPAQFLLWCAALATLCHAMIRRQKILFVTGVFAAIGLGGHLLYSAAQNVHINLWLALAIGGLLLMVLASICEKHGRKWLNNSREYWRQFNEWEAR